MAATANLKSTISLDATAFSAGVRKVRMSAANTAKAVGASFRKLGGIITKVATVASAITFSAAVVGVGKLVAASSRMASSYEGISVRMTAFLGDANKARSVLDKISAFSVVTPFETMGLQEATNKLLGAGIAGDSVVDVLKEIAAVSSDTEQVGELADALAKGFAKGKFQTEELNKFLERGINLMPELERITGLTGDALQKAIQKGLKFEDVRKALAGLSAEGGLFEGMLKKQSLTFAGLISTLSSNWDEFKTKFGAPINNALKPLLEFGIKKIQELTTIAGKLGEGFAVAIKNVTNALNSTVGSIDFTLVGPRLLAGMNLENALAMLKGTFAVAAAFLGNQIAKALLIAAEFFEQIWIAKGRQIANAFKDALEETATDTAKALLSPIERVKRAIKIGKQFQEANEKLGDKAHEGGDVLGTSIAAAMDKYSKTGDMFGMGKAQEELRKALEKVLSEGAAKIADAAADKTADAAAEKEDTHISPHIPLKKPPAPDHISPHIPLKRPEIMGPSRDLMSDEAKERAKERAMHTAKQAAATAAGFSGLAGLHGMQLDRLNSSVGIGTTTSFAKDRERLGIASGLRSGGIGDVRAVGKKAGAAIAKKEDTLVTTNQKLQEQIEQQKEQLDLLKEGLSN